MTAKKDQIQRLIRDIDQVLSRSYSRLPWGTAAQVADQRQLLEQIQHYLKAELAQKNQSAENPTLGNQAQDVMQSVIQDMTALRSSLLHPLHSEMASLMQQRTALLQEIRQLEAQRQTLQQSTVRGTSPAAIDTLQGVSDRADEMLTTLDTTLKVVFESLQKDIHTYHDSLSDGVDKLHTLGRQSEAMFSGLVRQLAEQFGRDASLYLSEQATLPAQPDTLPQPATVSVPSEPSSDQPLVVAAEPPEPDSDTDDAEIKMPYAGTELAGTEPSAELPSLESIHNLGELFIHFISDTPSDTESQPITVPVVAPQNRSTPDLPLSPEIRALREAMLPLFHGTEPAQLNPSIEAPKPSESKHSGEPPSLPELSIEEASAPGLVDTSSSLDIQSAPVAPLRSNLAPNANVFTLNGIDNVFLDEENPEDQPSSD